MASTDKLAVSTDMLDLDIVLELFGRCNVAKTNNSKATYIDQVYNLVAADEHVLQIIRTLLSAEDKNTRDVILKELHGYTDLSYILLKLIRLLIPIERFKASIVDVIINYKPNNECNNDKFFFNELNDNSEINLDLMYTRLLNLLITNFSRQILVSKIERRFITSLASHIIPKVNQPLMIFEKYLSDRLLSDESTIAVITLKPIFYLMVNHGLVQPNYYTRFKELLPAVFKSKQWQSLLNTLKLSLMSTCLPIKTRTEFGEDLATICLAGILSPQQIIACISLFSGLVAIDGSNPYVTQILNSLTSHYDYEVSLHCLKLLNPDNYYSSVEFSGALSYKRIQANKDNFYPLIH